MSVRELKDLRILVLRENWLGDIGFSALRAFLRAGCWASSVSESDYIPSKWQRIPGKVLARAIRGLAVEEFNDALLKEVELMRPHIFLAIKGTWVRADTLRAIAALGTTRYCLFADLSVFGHSPYLPHAIKEYEWIFTTKTFGGKDLEAQFGITNSSFFPPAFDPELHQPRQPTAELLQSLGSDVCFIGQWSPRKQEILEGLIGKRPSLRLKIWGNGWDHLPAASPLREHCMFRPIYGIGYSTAISCSKISLALLLERRIGTRCSSDDLITTRTFEIPACGGVLLHQRTEDVLKFFKEDESCLCFSDVDELVDKVDYLLANDGRRAEIASRGRAVVTREHSWDHRVREIFGHFLSGQPGRLQRIDPQHDGLVRTA